MNRAAKALFDIANRQMVEVERLANAALEIEARAYLRTHSHLKEFVAGMGTWFFVDNDGEILHPTDFDAAREFDRVIGRASYGPFRFTAEGKKITDW